jgi:Na+/melibiose symporter-like transporter
MNAATLLLLLLQTPTPSLVPTPHVPERTPALFTLIYVGGFAFIILLLLIGLIRSRRSTAPTTALPEDLPKDVRKRLGSTSTNRGLRALRWLFVLLAIAMFSFHIYWARYAAEKN